MDFNQFLEVAAYVIAGMGGLGALLFGAGAGYAQFKRGQRSVPEADMALFTKQMDEMRKIIADQDKTNDELREDLKKHTGEIGRLNGIIEEKDRKNRELMEILTGQDAGSKEYRMMVLKAIEDFKQSIPRLHERMDEIHSKLNTALSDGKVV